MQCVGEWAADEKHGYLQRYIGVSSAARAKYLKPKGRLPAGGAAFVDLFAGPGLIRRRDSGEVEDGSPLVALRVARAPFTDVILADLSSENIAALTHRTAEFGDRVSILQGDCNAIVGDIVKRIPPNGLNLALVDPFALEPLRFKTLATLAQVRRLDLVINFPTADVKRNLKHLYARKDNEVLDRALGTTRWRERVRSPSQVHLLGEILAEQLETLGYTGARNRTIRVESSRAELYRLIFASKHPVADEFWRKIVQHTPGGQRGLPGM